MTWVRFDDTFPEHPKVLSVGGDAAWLHVCALAYCNRLETDGEIPEAILHRLSDRKNPPQLAERLVQVGLWDRTDGGWVIHDYHDFQPSKADLDERRARQSAAGRAAGKRSGEARRARTDSERNANEIVRESFDNRSTKSNPDPTRPVTVEIDDDLESVTAPASSSSPSFARQVSTAAARRLAQRTGGIGNVEAWVTSTARKLYAERESRIRDAHAQGLSVDAAAVYVLSDTPAPNPEAALASARTYGAAVKQQHLEGEYADMPDINREAFMSELRARSESETWHNEAVAAYDAHTIRPNLKAV